MAGHLNKVTTNTSLLSPKTLDTMKFKWYIFYIIYQPFGWKYDLSQPPRPVHRWDQLARVSS
jgi:hypothetical protein